VEGIPVGTSLIDAHAGGVGVLESYPREQGASVAFAMYSNYIHYKFSAICFVLLSLLLLRTGIGSLIDWLISVLSHMQTTLGR